MSDGEPNDEFDISVRGEIDENFVWHIHARLRYRGGAEPDPSDPLFASGSRALMEEIGEEGRRGRASAATSVQLHLDVPGERKTIDLGDQFPDPTSVED